MSFVHCPSCHRAFDLRRQSSCARCVAPRTALEAGEPGDQAAVLRPRERPRSTPAESTADRIVAAVEEIAALIEAAPSEVLEAAQRRLAARGLAAPGATRWLPGGESLVRRAARRVREVGVRSVTSLALASRRSALEEGDAGPGLSGPRGAARAVATRVAARLRSAWADRGDQRA